MSSIIYAGKLDGITKKGRGPTLSIQVCKQFSNKDAPFYLAIVNQQRAQSLWYDLDGKLILILDSEGSESRLVLKSLLVAPDDPHKLVERNVRRYSTEIDYLDEGHTPFFLAKTYAMAGFDFADDILSAIENKRTTPLDTPSQDVVITAPNSQGCEGCHTLTPFTFKSLEGITHDAETRELLTKLREHLTSVDIKLFYTTSDGTYYFDMTYHSNQS